MYKVLHAKLKERNTQSGKLQVVISKSAIIENGANGIYADYFSVAASSSRGFQLRVFSGKITLDTNRIQRNAKSGIALRGVGSVFELKESLTC